MASYLNIVCDTSDQLATLAKVVGKMRHLRRLIGTMRHLAILTCNTRFMELLRYAPHLNTEKLKVNKFVFGLNVNIHAKVRILMPQTLHDVVQKALIAEEELINGGQRQDSSETSGKVSSSA
jgi:hypothetical protein